MMKRIALTFSIAGLFVAPAVAEEITLPRDAKLQLANGSVTLNQGQTVDVIANDGDFAVVVCRSLRGKIARAALTNAPASAATSIAALAQPASLTGISEDEFSLALQKSFAVIKPALARAEDLVIQGKYAEADETLLSCFPESSRTTAQTFVVANVLYKADPARSFKFHEVAAQQASHVPDVLLEWALEQHRRKDYEGALHSYRAYSQRRPNYAPALGLAAECALRLGRTAEALALWQKSERAKQGTLEHFEELVCEVNGGVYPDGERKKLLTQTEAGDEASACALLLLDTTWRSDWWNVAVASSRLKHDMDVVFHKFPSPGVNVRAARCVAECALLGEDATAAKKRELIRASGFLFDAQATLPDNGAALSALLNLAIACGDRPTICEQFGPRILALARSTKDKEIYNAAAYLYLDHPALAEIDQEGWDATHDVRFAASRIVGLLTEKKLTLDDPLLQRALKEFPENAEIAHVAVRLAADANRPLDPYLVNAIKAEYTKFSSQRPGADLPRPSAYTLRFYFSALSKTQPSAPAVQGVAESL